MALLIVVCLFYFFFIGLGVSQYLGIKSLLYSLRNLNYSRLKIQVSLYFNSIIINLRSDAMLSSL